MYTFYKNLYQITLNNNIFRDKYLLYSICKILWLSSTFLVAKLLCNCKRSSDTFRGYTSKFSTNNTLTVFPKYCNIY